MPFLPARRFALWLLLLLPATLSAVTSLRISADEASFETTAGDPFCWIGDTAWELFHRLDREEAVAYLDDRAEKGFTVIQAVVLAELDGLRMPNAYGERPFFDLDPTRPNPAYFAHVDFIIAAAAERGLVVGLLPTWGDKLPSSGGTGPIVFTPENAATYGRFLGQRYSDQPVVWILGGDRDPDVGNATAIWTAMAGAIKTATGGRQLMTYHPRGWSTSARFFADASWLDFHMFQSGHEIGVVPIDRLVAESASARPRKPFVNGEPAYEGIPIRFWEHVDFSRPARERVPPGVLRADGTIAQSEHFSDGFVSAGDVRRQAYLTFLLGAAGYTYGNNAIWQMFERGGPVMVPTLTDWRTALDDHGAQAMRHLRTFADRWPLTRVRPAPEVLRDKPAPRDGYPVIAAMNAERSCLIVQLPHGGTVTLDPTTLSGTTVGASWFDPRNGTSVSIEPIDRSGTAVFTAPHPIQEDWVLVLESR
jgi:hypothetical protein